MKRTRFPKLKRTRFLKKFKILYRSPRSKKWKKVRGVIEATGKKHAAFIASKHLTGKWIRPVLIK
jgi:hypothetical protein